MNSRIALLLALGLLLTAAWLVLTHRPAATVDVVREVANQAPAPIKGAHDLRRPRVPAPRVAMVPVSPEAPPEAPAANALAKLLKGGELKLTPEQAETYLQQNNRSGEALLAAARLTGKLGLVREAMEKFPNDPRVRLELALRGETPEERRIALDAFRQLASDNSLGDYLSALDHFKSGRTDDVVRDLVQAGGKNKFQDYALDHAQNAEEAFLSAGYGALESKAAGTFGVVLPHMGMLRDLATQMVELQKQYSQAGDASSAQAVGQMGLNLAWQMEGQPGRTLLGELVGFGIEKKFLASLSPDSPFGSDGRTVRDRMVEMEAHRQAIRELTSMTELLARIPEREAIVYFDRLKVNGELDALRWLKNKHGNP